MIDWHSHILPAMDDGCRNTEESLLLLEDLRSQGVDTVVATPHFYANDESVNCFLERREKSFESLKSQLPENAPKILLGAEVRYYPGISRMENLEKLHISGSNLLLLEMSVTKWTEYTIRELIELSGLGGITFILAHIERYLRLQHRSVWERLYESGILMQSNADFFVELMSRHKALSMLQNNLINFIGSDCHNTSTRQPHIKKAFDIIEKKFGKGFIEQINEYGKSMLI